ncbi:uncharacterized protein LOC122843952 [Gambusia affinis]|uniref:uncharacterized protein LOC122843952 n=1 Tax=Gambusia affinis TaxID=33528 RepID=UPI001CDD21A1|nr:uncharacterized protein LOC122843952 [Gambusia affinis]
MATATATLTNPTMAESLKSTIKQAFQQCDGERGPAYLEAVSKIVSKYRYTEVDLDCLVGAKLTFGPVEDTEYKDRPAVVDAWEMFYLPKTTEMEVIGYVEGTPYPCDQLVLMICGDHKVYGFDGDELHLVASSPIQVLDTGIADPALQSYYHGETFEDMTTEDWEKVELSPEGKRLEEEHRKLVASHKSTLLKNLKIIQERQSLACI